MRFTRLLTTTLSLIALLIPGPRFLSSVSSALAQSPGNFSTLSTTGTATLNGDVLMCSGHPWLDVRCPANAGGAVGDGSHDDTAAIQAAVNSGAANNWPVHIPSGTYKLTSRITIDYAGQSGKGFRLISHGASPCSLIPPHPTTSVRR